MAAACPVLWDFVREPDTADTELLQRSGHKLCCTSPLTPLHRLSSFLRVLTCRVTPKKPLSGDNCFLDLGIREGILILMIIMLCRARTEVIFKVIRFVAFVPQCRLSFVSMYLRIYLVTFSSRLKSTRYTVAVCHFSELGVDRHEVLLLIA